AQSALLAAAPDHDPRTAVLDRARHVQRLLDPVMLAGEARGLFGEHRPADLQGFLEAVEALARARELEAERVVLLLVPSCADPEDRPAARDDVERRGHLGEDGRVPVRHAGHERADVRSVRARRQPAEQRVPLQHRLRRAAEGRQLPEVIHDPERFEARVLAGDGEPGDVLEHLVVRNPREGEVRELEAERRHCSILSKIVPVPRPPPQHIVTSASAPSRRSSSWRAVVTRRAPGAPPGGPIAMAPPVGWARSTSGWGSRSPPSTTPAKGSWVSTRAKSDT